MWKRLALLGSLTGCHALFGLDDVTLVADAAVAGPDARLRFGTPRRIATETGTSDYANDLSLTADQQHLVYSNFPLAGGVTPTSNRQTSGPTDPTMWPPSTDLGIPNARTLKLSPDGLFIAVSIGDDVKAFRRPNIGGAWTAADGEIAGAVTIASTEQERPGTITADGLQIPIYRRSLGGGDAYVLYLFVRESPAEAFSDASSLLGVIRATHPAPMYSTFGPHLSADGLTLVYSMNAHSPALGPSDLWIANRDDPTEPFGTPRILAEINDPELNDGDPWLSPDGSRLYFSRSSGNLTLRPEEWGLYVSDAEPL